MTYLYHLWISVYFRVAHHGKANLQRQRLYPFHFHVKWCTLFSRDWARGISWKHFSFFYRCCDLLKLSATYSGIVVVKEEEWPLVGLSLWPKNMLHMLRRNGDARAKPEWHFSQSRECLTHAQNTSCFVAVLHFLLFSRLSVKKKNWYAHFIRSSVPTKPGQKYFENRRILKELLYTNTTLIRGYVYEGCVIDPCF